VGEVLAPALENGLHNLVDFGTLDSYNWFHPEGMEEFACR